ncbi:hypothetical protein CRE_31209 [Caenorhabditis remanei]|uniref:Uncharacterized protein n=1 Tax=Caenorhabditis remanei TaxID=31234 RepID=E3MLL0_CAERE|nr:hypothetical protein CRE_31209 [Caenorhabditis remanei]
MSISGDNDDIEMAVMDSEDQPLLQPQLRRAKHRVPILKRLNDEQQLNLLMVTLIAAVLLGAAIGYMWVFLAGGFSGTGEVLIDEKEHRLVMELRRNLTRSEGKMFM